MLEGQTQALILTNLHNIYYLSGFWGTSATILVTENRQYFMTDARYIQVARDTVKDFDILETRNPLEEIAKIIKTEKISELNFEEDISFAYYQSLKEAVSCKLQVADNYLERLRMIKDSGEIEIIKQACSISDRAFDEVLNFIEPGLSEVQVANFLDFKMREFGASGISFETIVASGKRSFMPHGVASQKLLQMGDTITLDFGCYYNHYASDMTRTIFLGQPDDKMLDIYTTVLASNQKLIDATKAGLLYKDYDGIARQVIDQAGYGQYFTHGIGHGLGIDVHEKPFFGKTSIDSLEKNMVVTDEPGIYLDDFGGVRIEDDLLVTEQTCEVLTRASKEIIIL